MVCMLHLPVSHAFDQRGTEEIFPSKHCLKHQHGMHAAAMLLGSPRYVLPAFCLWEDCMQRRCVLVHVPM